MTGIQFLQGIESYYGRYERPAQKATVLQYLNRFTDPDLAALYEQLILTFSGKFRFAPDVAVIEEVKCGMDKDMAWPQQETKRLPESTEPFMPFEEASSKLKELLVRLANKSRMKKAQDARN